MFLEPPADHVFQCVTLDDRNLGNFNTGYRQFLFTAKDEALECTETLDLVHSSHSPTPGVIEKLEFSITKAACDFVECPAGEVQEAYFCGCMAEPEVEGDLFDFDLDDRNRVARVMVGEKFTMKEASATLDGRTYTYDLPTVPDSQCAQEVSRVDTGYYRQIVFEATEGNCEYNITRTNVDGETT